MWAKLDDALLDHRKIIAAGVSIGGRNGELLAIGFYTWSLLWAAKHLTDGWLPAHIVKRCHCQTPIKLAAIFVKVGLFDASEGGYQIHHYREWNASAADVIERRRYDRERKRQDGSAGARSRWSKGKTRES